MLRIILFLIFSGYSGIILAQVNQKIQKADSLVNVLEYATAIKELNLSILNTSDISEKHIFQNKLAEINIISGKFDEAQNIIQSINPENPLIKAQLLINSGFLNLSKGKYDLAQENLLQAQQLINLSGNQNSKEAARCYSMLGSLYGSTGKYNQAEENYVLSLQINQSLFGNESEAVAASYNDMGTLYLESNPEQSLSNFEIAFDTYSRIHQQRHPKVAIALTNIGIAYRKLELLGDAITNFDAANKTWKSIYPEGHPNQGLVLSFLGQCYRQLNNFKIAGEYFDQAISIYRKAYGDKHPDLAKIYLERGILYLNNKQYAPALSTFQESILANSNSFNSTDININPKIDDYYNGLSLLYSLKYKAQALEERHFGKTLSMTDLKLALQCLISADSLINDIRHKSDDENDKLTLGEIGSEIYEDGVRISYAISQLVIHKSYYEEMAFRFSEKSKSAILQESIADTKAKEFSGIPANLLDQEKAIRSSITDINQKISSKPTDEEEKRLRRDLYNLNIKYNEFIKELELKFPNYYNLKYNRTSYSLNDIIKKIDHQTALVSYFISEKDKRLYQFIMTDKGLKIKYSSIPVDLDRLLKGFNNSLYYSNFATYKNVASTLGELLKPKVSGNVNNLVIIPTGKLGTLPFEALPLGKVGDQFSNTAYLVSFYSISYNFSAELFISGIENKASSNILLCAPVDFNNDLELGSLPGSEEEVSMIANLFAQKAQTLVNANATETAIKQMDLNKLDILHFATHGIVDENNPSLSRIFFNTTQQDDGSLYAGEIYNLSLSANLAVLSACQTGLGKISKGEGVIGLSRALTYAGAKNLIVSFWRVSDASTVQLMTDFYSGMLENNNYARSLQKAKLKLLKSKEYNAPYFWAPFVLIGK